MAPALKEDRGGGEFTPSRRPVILYSDSQERGGAEEHLLHLALHLPSRGWRCEVSIPAVDTGLQQKPSGLSKLVDEIKAAGVQLHLRPNFDNGISLIQPRGVKCLLQSLTYFAVRKPALVHFILPELDLSRLPILAAAILGIPLVLGFRLAQDKPIPPFNRSLYHWLASKPSRWLALSAHNRATLGRVFDLSPARFDSIPNGIDHNKYGLQPSERKRLAKELRSELGLDNKIRIVIGIGRIEERKGFRYFMKAIPRVMHNNPETVFLWVGEDPRTVEYGLHNQDAFRELLETTREMEELWFRRSCIHLLGRRDDIPKLLAAADVFVLPSLSEGQPRVLLEAMAAGLPCIAARGTGLSEIVTHEKEGLLVPAMDGKALAGAINRVLEEPKLAKSLGRSAASRAKEFDLERMLDRIEAVYRELI